MRQAVMAFSVLALVSCSGGSPTSPSGPAFDTAPRRMLDGAGNPGPLTVRLIRVSPEPGTKFVGSMNFKSEVCMDAIPNPTNSEALRSMHVGAFGSADGIGPLGPTAALFSGNLPYMVANGTCFELMREPHTASSGAADPQYLFLPGGSRYLMFAASYAWGPMQGNTIFNWPAAPCPSYQVIGTTFWPLRGPECILRVGYDLGYNN